MYIPSRITGWVHVALSSGSQPVFPQDGTRLVRKVPRKGTLDLDETFLGEALELFGGQHDDYVISPLKLQLELEADSDKTWRERGLQGNSKSRFHARMTAPFKEWTVLPHGKLTRVNERIVTVVGELKMPLLELPRRMTAVRSKSGDLVIFSAIALREPDMAELEALGRPAFLIVPSERHRLDAPGYAQRYPNITVVAPRAGVEKIGEVVRVDTSTPDFGDPTVRYVEIAADSALEVDGDDGLTIIVNDLIGDIHGESGLGGWLLQGHGIRRR